MALRSACARRTRYLLGIMNSSIYMEHVLCSELDACSLCFVARKYIDGKFEDVFHEHVPQHRISQSSVNEALLSLALYFGSYEARSIINSRLNRRRGGPSQYPQFSHHVDYPEPGVKRHYMSSSTVIVWQDSVIIPQKFRKGSFAK